MRKRRLMNANILFTCTIFLSAFLMFLIQPMLSKIMLPKLGGSPAVWQTSMVFYQALLLGGYIYAHLSTRWLGARNQAKLHMVLLGASAISLPIVLRATNLMEATSSPVAWLLLTLLFSVGLPFFVLSANAPLVQHWYACHGKTRNKDPYMLYSASNLGSFAALFCFPLLIEPLLSLQHQTNYWSVLYGVFMVLLGVCALQLNRHFFKEVPMEEVEVAHEKGSIPTWKKRGWWVLLAFVPSSLMLGLTTHVTTDIAAVPLLWIIPLALYLLTFVLVFNPKMPLYKFFLDRQVLLVALLLVVMIGDLTKSMPISLIIYFIAFFGISMVCHGQIALSRPKSSHLTEFYVWMSLGGVLGGVFNALIVPQIFVNTLEFPIILVLSCFLRPEAQVELNKVRSKLLDYIIPIGLSASMFGFAYLATNFSDSLGELVKDVMQMVGRNVTNQIISNHESLAMVVSSFCVLSAFVLPIFCEKRTIRFGLCVAVLVFFTPVPPYIKIMGNILHQERNFFGVSRVEENEESRLYFHGTTLHGVQHLDEQKRLQLLSYYAPTRDFYARLPKNIQSLPVAVAGLGAGTLACLGQKNQRFDFYEIDVAVKNIAENTKLFTYLRDCPPNSKVIIDDARLGIEKAPNHEYGTIIMDAYSSDSLPVHLITKEALAIYMQKLDEHGVIAFHISNKFIDLKPVLANLAADANLVAMVRNFPGEGGLFFPSKWVVMARDIKDFNDADMEKRGWVRLTPNGKPTWTDDYSNLIGAIVYF